MPGFEIVRSRVAGRFGFLDVREDAVSGPAGEEFVRYTVVHPGAVAVVPGDADGDVLLLRQYRVAAGRTIVEIPAGKCDVDGEPPEDTARRELVEEIGWSPGRLVKLAEFYNSPGFCDEYTHLYLGLELSPAEAPGERKAEERYLVVAKVGFDDLDDLVVSGEIVDAKTLIGLSLARRYLEGTYPGLAPGDPGEQ